MEEKITYNDKTFTLSEYGVVVQKFCIDNSLSFDKLFNRWMFTKNGTPASLLTKRLIDKFYPYFFPFFKALLFKEIEDNGFTPVYATKLLSRTRNFMYLKTLSFDTFIEHSYRECCVSTLINQLHYHLIIDKNSDDMLSLIKK